MIQDISATWELTNINAGIQVANPNRMNDVSRAFGIYGRARANIREKLEEAILAKMCGPGVAVDHVVDNSARLHLDLILPTFGCLAALHASLQTRRKPLNFFGTKF